MGGVWSTIVQNNACALLLRILSGDIIYTECINYYHNDNLYIGLYLHTFWLYFKVCHRYICCYLNGQSRSTYGEGCCRGGRGGKVPLKVSKRKMWEKRWYFHAVIKIGFFFGHSSLILESLISKSIYFSRMFVTPLLDNQNAMTPTIQE